MKKELKIVAIVLAAVLVFLIGVGLGTSKGIEIDINVQGAAGSNQSAQVVQQTQPAATQAPATTAAPVAADTTAAPAADTTAAPSADTTAAPQASAADTTAAPQASTSGVPSTPEEVVAKYNEVINAAKKEQNITIHKINDVQMECTDCSVSFAVSTINKILESFIKTSEWTRTYENGVQTDGDSTPDSVIYPCNRECTLTASDVQSATASASGDGYVLNLQIISEKSVYDGTNTTNPTSHQKAMDPLNLATLELPMGAKITAADMTYPGATMEATVNGAGKLVKLHINLPLEGTGTGKVGLEASAGLKGSMDDVFEFTYN